MASTDYFDRLVSIKGIGKKTAERIESSFPSEDDLVAALEGEGYIKEFEDTPLVLQFIDELREEFGIGTEEAEEEAPTTEAAPEPEAKVEDTPKATSNDEEPKVDFTDPNFDWQNESLWRSNPEAVDFWLLTKT